MRITLTIILLLSSITLVKAQESGKVRAGLEFALLYPHEGGIGFSRSLEIKYNIQDKMNIGLRYDNFSFNKTKSYSAMAWAVLATYDYYFISKDRLLVPFFGAGLGYFTCYTDEEKYSNVNPLIVEVKYSNPTCLLRLGTEIKKFRISLTYNVIRKHSMANIQNRNSDNLSLNIGFYLGGGKYRN